MYEAYRPGFVIALAFVATQEATRPTRVSLRTPCYAAAATSLPLVNMNFSNLLLCSVSSIFVKISAMSLHNVTTDGRNEA
jgi:hypothetical protein